MGRLETRGHKYGRKSALRTKTIIFGNVAKAHEGIFASVK